MHVFVTGGSGFVGGHLIERLVRDGHRVSALARSESAATAVSKYGAEPVKGDLGAVPVEALRGCDAVIHVAAYAEDYGPREVFEKANIEGTRQLLEAARAANVGRFVHVSTEAVLFNGADLVDIDESVPIPERHRHLYPETKAAAERLVLGANSEAMTTIALRPRLVWGPRDTSVLPTLLTMVEKGGFWWVDGGRRMSSTCHVSNAVEGLVLALTRGKGGRAYFLTDGEDRTQRELLTAWAGTRGVTLPQRSLPGGLARALAAIVEGSWRLLRLSGKPPMSRLAVDMMASTITLRDAAAREDLGYRPIVTFADGLRQLSPG